MERTSFVRKQIVRGKTYTVNRIDEPGEEERFEIVLPDGTTWDDWFGREPTMAEVQEVAQSYEEELDSYNPCNSEEFDPGHPTLYGYE